MRRNPVSKLRTVVWDFQGEAVPDDLLEDMVNLRKGVSGSGDLWEELSSLLSLAEMRALRKRLDLIIQNPVFPRPGYYRSVPWPSI